MDVPATTTVACRTRAYRIDEYKIRTLAEFICARLGVAGQDLSVSLVGSSRIRRLNRDFRGIDKATDVLSFPQQEWQKPARVVGPAKARPRSARRLAELVLGDVVISLPNAEKNAKDIGQPLDREVCFLMVHGILHLCGHDHIKLPDERVMLAAQKQLMTALSSAKGGPLWRTSVKRRSR